MILVDHEIKDAVATQRLTITEFDDRSVQPASYDLRIGRLVYAPPHSDKPHDLSANGGAYRLPPYGNAVLTTLEDLKIPKNMLGHIGLKSGFTRRGMVASTGPQIDPGFEGKLFVSIFNVTAVSHVLEYKDTFLTIEFDRLDQEPTNGYSGPYQGKYTLGAEVLDALVRLEGLTLSQIHSQFTELKQHVAEWSALAGRFDEFLTEMRRQTKAFEHFAKRLSIGLAEVQREKPVEVRRLKMKEATDEILTLFRARKRLFYSDIAEALQLDFSTVIRACENLRRRGLIEGASNGKARSKKAGN